MTQKTTDIISARIVRRFRTRALKAIVVAEGNLDGVWADMAERLRRRLGAIGRTTAQVEAILREEFERTVEARAAHIATSIEQGASAAAASDSAIGGALSSAGAAEVATLLPFRRPDSRQKRTPSKPPPPKSEES